MYASSQLDDGFLEVSVLFFYILHGVLGLVWGRRVFFYLLFCCVFKIDQGVWVFISGVACQVL